MDDRYVFDFSEGTELGRELLGGKGIGLAEMTAIGIPVPAGFTVTTAACVAYMGAGRQVPAGLEEEVAEHMSRLEERTGKRFGDPSDPLLVSVRSGAAVSMPGMMDTILNLGLNDEAVEGLARATGNPRFAYDAYRRLIQMYGDVVAGVDAQRFEEALAEARDRAGAAHDGELDAAQLEELAARFKQIYRQDAGEDFPQDARDQLAAAIRAVFDSWDLPRARAYRRANGIADDLGTAVNVVQMVFGNKGEESGTGVAFTRDPATGEQGLYGEFLANAQGEDVVAGVRTPQPLEELRDSFPEVFDELLDTMRRLEQHYRDAQDIEFTIDDGRLFLLQTRPAKRHATSMVRVAVDLVEEGLISREEALGRLDPAQLDQLLHPMIDPKADYEVVARGLNASPGAATGSIVFDADTAEERGRAGESVILVRQETSPDDFHGMVEAKGILTAVGGLTSHAAVVARGMGKPCVSGAGSLRVDYAAQTMSVAGVTLKQGDIITIDGSAGQVLQGEVAMLEPELSGEFATLMGWADKTRKLKVRANADTPLDARTARNFGAEGIGLCRTEHMFFEGDRILAVREMILADDETGRRAALAKLLPMQRHDFAELFTIMSGLPVTIRLLDPPLHEFLPHTEAEIAEVATAMATSPDKLKRRAAELHEFNPMLGFRGCRLAIAYPEIAEMQARAIFEAAVEAQKTTGAAVVPEIMVPLVVTRAEFDLVKERIDAMAAAVASETGTRVSYQTGTMIELPRACLVAHEIAETAEFFSFGTNDLTQTALGISRDDAATFLGTYTQKGILASDPFVTIDQDGVGELVRIGVERGRRTRPDIKLGICGEHGGDPASVRFCSEVGLDYVSCSPYRVPIARLAAAQAALGGKVASQA
ncbi:MAG: pyruvate, phosphate dikinase [Microvirga sp.]